MAFLEEIKSRNKNLAPVQTRITRPDGKIYIESFGTLKEDSSSSGDFFVVDTKPDDALHKVIDGLFIGSQDAATNYDELKRNNVSSILNVAVGVTEMNCNEFCYKSLPIFDTPDFNIRPHFEEANRFIKESLGRGSILVHCNAGISRSSTIIIAFLMIEKQLGLEDALELVKRARPVSKPNPGFRKQLHHLEVELKG